ncbi:ATP synthase F1 subunit delta [Desulfobotulus mexicanus]|uniref:ATP synthase subunit delta n=1 Tax=Desulfobotulus mexicanus TaxID=2586642 RepID=A0A5S5MFU1_9BACT|nr:ATP synthase F1 subunit delta [Desulfobotulus mexicanus]TYT74601.1 ATP synthase F1 subunit delta [Desulfobotulus mexicanus]
MKNLAVARRYAKALLLIGKEDGQMDTYRQELQDVCMVFQENEGLRQILSNPLHARTSRRQILGSVLQKMSLTQVMQSFMLLLFDKGRIVRLADVERSYRDLADEFQNIARARITSAVSLSDTAVAGIRNALVRMTNREVVLDVHEDPRIIGGIVTKVGDLVYDGSIRTQLRNLRESFKRGEGI